MEFKWEPDRFRLPEQCPPLNKFLQNLGCRLLSHHFSEKKLLLVFRLGKHLSLQEFSSCFWYWLCSCCAPELKLIEPDWRLIENPDSVRKMFKKETSYKPRSQKIDKHEPHHTANHYHMAGKHFVT